MWEHVALPRVDVFSLTAAGTRWVNTYWLFEVVLYPVYRLLGLTGVWMAFTGLVLLILGIVSVHMRWLGMSWTWTSAGTLLVFLAGQPRGYGWGEHASLITALGIAFVSIEISSWRDRNVDHPSWLWIAGFWVWACAHRGFLLGWATLTAAQMAKILASGGGRKSWISLTVWGFVTLGATAMTPYGVRIFEAIALDSRLSAETVTGWAQTPWRSLEMFWGLIACLITWAVFSFIRAPQHLRTNAAWLTGAAFLAALAARYAYGYRFFVIFCVPWLMTAIAKCVPLRFRNRTSYCLTGILILGAALQIRPTGPDNPRRFPIAACDFIADSGLEGPWFNDYSFGGYWLWRFYMQRPVFMDGRYPLVEGYVPLLQAIMESRQRPQDWQNFLRRYGVRGCLIETPQTASMQSLVEKHYFPAEQWRLIYADRVAMVFVRR